MTVDGQAFETTFLSQARSPSSFQIEHGGIVTRIFFLSVTAIATAREQRPMFGPADIVQQACL